MPYPPTTRVLDRHFGWRVEPELMLRIKVFEFFNEKGRWRMVYGAIGLGNRFHPSTLIWSGSVQVISAAIL